jgi:hypothetical protein
MLQGSQLVATFDGHVANLLGSLAYAPVWPGILPQNWSWQTWKPRMVCQDIMKVGFYFRWFGQQGLSGCMVTAPVVWRAISQAFCLPLHSSVIFCLYADSRPEGSGLCLHILSRNATKDKTEDRPALQGLIIHEGTDAQPNWKTLN